MKKALVALLVLLFVGAFAGSLYYLYKKSQKPPVVYETESPAVATIIQKAVATGSVVPRKEVEIKSQIPGIIQEIYVEAGKLVKQGDVLAKITVVPDMVSLSSAESRVKRAEIGLDNAARDLERYRGLSKDGVVAEAELQRAEKAWADTQEELAAARDTLDLIRKGTARRSGETTNTLVRATASGMVLVVPRLAGNSVIPSNNFNDGTTIATIADMDDLIFKGKVDESEVGKIKPGMDLQLKIGALEGQKFEATLEYIAPKGVEENGAIQFEIRAALKKKEGALIRANLSANADIVLARRDEVLAINEAVLQFDAGKPFVEVETTPQHFEKRTIETGLSDGIQIEIVSGLSKTDKVKNASKGAPK